MTKEHNKITGIKTMEYIYIYIYKVISKNIMGTIIVHE